MKKWRQPYALGITPPEYFQSEKFYTMGPGIDFPMVMNYKDTDMPIAQAYFYFLNGHNDVVYFSNSSFNDYETYEYNPWGVLLTSSNKNNLLYTAREFDSDTGLQFNRFRYYNSNFGRFGQKDLIKSLNVFIYVYNKPIQYYDPIGLYGRWVALRMAPPSGGSIGWYAEVQCGCNCNDLPPGYYLCGWSCYCPSEYYQTRTCICCPPA